ncbi:hypothetical protein ES705_32077 [subsurface metagenome]
MDTEGWIRFTHQIGKPQLRIFTEKAGAVPLSVAVHQEDPRSRCEACSQVDGRGSLTDAALAVCDCNFSHAVLLRSRRLLVQANPKELQPIVDLIPAAPSFAFHPVTKQPLCNRSLRSE